MRNPDRQTVFHFKQFDVSNCLSAMKVGTDGVLLGAWAFADVESGKTASGLCNIMDVGCGTGVISLMMAQRFANADIVGVEIDADAAYEAALNFENSMWMQRLRVVHADFTSFVDEAQERGKFDFIVSNPPFFTNGVRSGDVSRNMARHCDSLTIAELLRHGVKLLNECGRIAVILPMELFEEWRFQTALNGLVMTRLCVVSTTPRKAPRRFMSEVSTLAGAKRPLEESTLTIHTALGEYSSEYVKLVEPYYTKI